MSRYDRSVLPVVLAAVLAVGPPEVLAQAGSITGRVVDAATLQPLAGAQVSLPQLGRGSLAQSDGRYVILDVPVGTHEVQVAFIGYGRATQQVTVAENQQATADFSLRSSAISLEEVVVTGAGVQEERRRLGFASASVSAGELEIRPIQNVSQALSGQIAGVMPAIPIGESGAAAPIRIRGQVSLSQRNEPLLVIDGVRQDGSLSELTRGNMLTSRLNDINPEDIERIEVIKGAAAATLFGTEASAGVIQIFTKRGREGPARYSFTVDQTMSIVPTNTIPPNVAYDPETKTFVEQHPAKAILKTGHQQNYNLAISGGIPDFNYYLSGRYMRDGGNVPQARAENMSLRTRFDMNHGQKLRSELGLNVIRNRVRTAPGAANIGVMGLHVFANPLAADPENGRPFGESFVSYLDVTSGGYAQSLVDRYSVDAKATYQWLPNVTSQVVVGYNQVHEENTETIELGQGHIAAGTTTGRRDLRNLLNTQMTVDFNTSVQTRLAESVGLQVWGGGQAFFQERKGSRMLGLDFPAAGLTTISGAGRITTTEENFEEVINAGLFAQTQLDIGDRLFLTAGVRADGNSAFGETIGLSTYPKVSGSYVISDERFWPGGDFWSLLRLRAAYGTSGLQPGAFDAVQTWEPRSRLGVAILWPANYGNPDLKPERSTELEMGADLGLFDQRLGIEFTYFTRRTTDGIIAIPRSATLGFIEPQLVNLGEMEASGIEALVNWQVIQNASLDWSITGTAGTVHQKVISLGLPGTTFYTLDSHRARAVVAEGYAPGTFRTTVLDPDDPYRLTVPIEELRSIDQIIPNTLKNAAGEDSIVYHKAGIPTLTGTIGTEVGLPGNVRLRALFSGAGGFSVHDESQVIMYQNGVRPDAARIIAELDDPNTPVERRRELAREHASKSNTIWGNYIQDGDYLRFQELSLSYRTPSTFAQRFGLDNLSVNLALQNLALWSKAETLADPGTTGARNQTTRSVVTTIHRMSLPTPRTFTISLQGGW